MGMKNRLFKSIISLVIIMVMAVSTMTASMVNTSASTKKYKYSVEIITANSYGDTCDTYGIALKGTKGEVGWISVYWPSAYMGNQVFWNFYDPDYPDAGSSYIADEYFNIDIGEITDVTVMKIEGSDGLYPEYVRAYGPSSDAVIYCADWIDENDKEFHYSITDNVYRLKIRTADVNYAGTDADVYATLYDENDNKSDKINLSDIYPFVNAFERGDVATLYVSVPDSFSKLKRIEFSVEADVPFFYSSWIAYGIEATQVSGDNKGYTCSKIIKDQCGVNETMEVKFY